MVVNKLRGKVNKHGIEPKILKVDFHMSFHDFSWLIGQNWMGHGEILAIEAGGLFGHFHLCHKLIQHIDVVFELDSDASNVILLVDEFGFVKN